MTKPFCVFSSGRVFAEGTLVSDSDPDVKGREAHFETVEAAAAARATVESASAVPGALRSLSRPAKKSAPAKSKS